VDQMEKQQVILPSAYLSVLTLYSEAHSNIRLTRNLCQPPPYDEHKSEDVRPRLHERVSLRQALSSPPLTPNEIDNVLKELAMISLYKYPSVTLSA
jgi:hypothetical protein